MRSAGSEEARDEIERLIRFLDETDNHMELEDVDEDGEGEDPEPSLGSFDRMTNQDMAWRSTCVSDREVDDCDREDDDPNEAKQQPLEMQ